MTSFFRKLFGSNQPLAAGGETPAVPSRPAGAPPAAEREGMAVHSHMRVGLAHDVGRVRSTNEDSLMAVSGMHFGDSALPSFGLFVVADGMGGYQHGEKASSTAAKTLTRMVVEQIYLSLLKEVEPSERPPIQEVIRSAVLAAHRAVSTSTPEGGTTVTAALVIGQQLTLAHVGDSRAYILGPEGMEQATRDHSLVQRLQELGQLSAKEASIHPQRNVLTRALGQGDGLEVDVNTFYLSPGSRLLLCSDGLWSYVPEETVLEIIESSPDVQDACDRLAQAANDAGGHDNISAMIIRMAE